MGLRPRFSVLWPRFKNAASEPQNLRSNLLFNCSTQLTTRKMGALVRAQFEVFKEIDKQIVHWNLNPALHEGYERDNYSPMTLVQVNLTLLTWPNL